MINSLLAKFSIFSLLFISLSIATQARKFYNTEGKSIEAELLSVENDTAVMKLTNGRKIKVPITKLSKADQNFIKTWWNKNKNLLTEGDVRLSIKQKSVYTKKPETKYTKNNKVKTSESEVTFLCGLDNYSAKTAKGIKATYTIHKRVSKRDKNGSFSEIKLVRNTIPLNILKSHKKIKFTTDAIKCKDSSDQAERSSLRETVIAIVLTLSVDDKEFLTQSHPENFIRRLKEEEAREEGQSTADSIRDEQKDIDIGKREETQDSGRGRKDREDAEREKRKREALKASEERKRKEKEAR